MYQPCTDSSKLLAKMGCFYLNIYIQQPSFNLLPKYQTLSVSAWLIQSKNQTFAHFGHLQHILKGYISVWILESLCFQGTGYLLYIILCTACWSIREIGRFSYDFIGFYYARIILFLKLLFAIFCFLPYI